MRVDFNFLIKRFASLVIDSMICASIIVLPSVTGLTNNSTVVEGVLVIVAGFMLIMKDALGCSLGKRIFGLHLIDDKTSKKPKAWKLILRNVLLPLWIIDGTVCLCTNGQRLSDIILKVRVIEYNPNNLL